MSKQIAFISFFLIVIFGLNTVLSLPVNFDSAFIRHQLVMLSGFLTFGYMSISIILSIKSTWLKKRLNGFGKMYQLHKGCGIAATIALIVHWALASDSTDYSGLFEHSLQRIGSNLGEIVLFLFLPFVVISMTRIIKRDWSKLIHKLGGIIFIVCALHSVLLLDSGMSQLVLNLCVVIMTVAGTYCAWLSLSGRISSPRSN